MEQKPTITAMQWSLLFVGCALAFPYTFMPIMSVPSANQDILIVFLLGMVFAVIFHMPLLFLMNKFRGFNAIEIGDVVLGKFFGKIPHLLFLVVCMFCFIACTMASIVFMKYYFFTYTPIWAMLLYIIIPVTYAAYKGAGTLGRLATILVPFIMLTILFYFILGFSHFDLRVFQPVLVDSKITQLALGGFFTAARISEILILYIFSYFLDQKVKIYKTYAKSILVFAICFFPFCFQPLCP